MGGAVVSAAKKVLTCVQHYRSHQKFSTCLAIINHYITQLVTIYIHTISTSEVDLVEP